MKKWILLFVVASSFAYGAKKPNIVVFLADDQGWGDLSVNGNSLVSTPHIDAIAKQGVTFENFFVSPVCAPTRADLLTGRYYQRSGITGTSKGRERMNLDEVTIADALKAAGYRTGTFGKWHNGSQYPYHPNGRGFDEFYGFASGHWGNYFDAMMDHNGKVVEGEGFIVDDCTSKAIDFISAESKQPFFMYLAFNTPHGPWQVPDRWWKKYENEPAVDDNRYSKNENKPRTRAVLAMMENIDWNVGRVKAKLIEMGELDNTIILYFSDNGPNGLRYNGDMKGQKGTLDEGGVRSPSFMQWPAAIKAGTSVPQIASAMDIFPTMMDLADIPYQSKKPFDGKSLKPLLFGGEERWQDRIIVNNAIWRNQTSVRSERFRLDQEEKLYDMHTDIGQYKDVSKQYPEVKAALIAYRDNWQKEVVSELPKMDTRPFLFGHPDSLYTHAPARDGNAHGHIKRSNKFPNDSYFLNWEKAGDKVTWDIEVVEDGEFEVSLYYAMTADGVGSQFNVSFGENAFSFKVDKAHDVPLIGMEGERAKRNNSYVKRWATKTIGTINLNKGPGQLTLSAKDLSAPNAFDFRMLVFERVR